MENYEKLLDEAYEDVRPIVKCERFEILKVEGHVQGGKTIISNFMQVVRCLRRDAEHLSKFLFGELATKGEIAGDRLILTKKVSSQRINEKIEKYVNNYVLCQKCKKPDTEIVEEDGKKIVRCLACGHKRVVG